MNTSHKIFNKILNSFLQFSNIRCLTTQQNRRANYEQTTNNLRANAVTIYPLNSCKIQLVLIFALTTFSAYYKSCSYFCSWKDFILHLRTLSLHTGFIKSGTAYPPDSTCPDASTYSRQVQDFTDFAHFISLMGLNNTFLSRRGQDFIEIAYFSSSMGLNNIVFSRGGYIIIGSTMITLHTL